MNTADAKTSLFSPGTLRTLAFFVAGALLGAVSVLQLAPAAGAPGDLAANSGVVGGEYVDEQGNVVAGDVSGQGIAANKSGGGNGGQGAGAATTPSASGSTATGGAAPSAATSGGSSSAGGSGGGGAATGGGGGGPTGGSSSGGSGPTGGSQFQCAPGRNGGATDQGVTATSINMATTTVDSGAGASFLRDVRYGMEAMRNEVNRAGGVCGRQLAIRYVDDGWEAQRGAQFLRTFINQPDPAQKIFAIPVAPSSEGLGVVIETGDIDKAQIPVVGTNGLSVSQYQRADGTPQPWVWPVAAATVSSARIMAKHAFDQGARNFSIVYDRDYRFGKEAAVAFNAEVTRLTGKPVLNANTDGSCAPRFCGVESGQQSYSSQVTTFNRDKGDFVALFLEPTTAQSWMADANTPPASGTGAPKYGYGAAQPLFTRSFAQNCKADCHNMLVWTGFKPNIEGYRSDAAVQRYVTALKQTNPQADEFNQFAQGAYVGMQLLVEGLRKTGPNLTRLGLKAALDSTDLRSGLTMDAVQQFRANNRFTATTMQAFAIQYQGTFSGWRTGPKVRDPRPTAGAG